MTIVECECQNDKNYDKCSYDEQNDLTQFKPANFCLLKFFEESQTAEFDRPEFSKVQEVKDKRDGGCSQSEQNNRI
jgi:hypothetical protein